MDTDALYGFGRVWDRVTGTAADTGVSDADRLRSFIEDESRDAAFYAAMARQGGPGAGIYAKLAAEERGHLRSLQTEYFLLTGDSAVPPASCPLLRGRLSDLRLAYLGEKEGARAYMEAAASAGGSLPALFAAHAADETRHAATIREIIQRSV